MKQTRKNAKRKRKRLLLAAATAIILLAVLVIIPGSRAPSTVKGVKADPCYAGIDISWDRASGADGYYIYMLDGGEYVRVGETGDGKECSFCVEDYQHDKEYQFKVAGYNSTILSHKIREGKPCEPVTAEYVSSDHAQKIPILAYHLVLTDDADLTDDDMKTGLIIRQSDFDRQMKYLHDEGFTTLTMDEYCKWHEGRQEFPEKTCVITFDDGDYCIYHLAYPILKKYDLAGTIFCIGRNIKDKTPDYDPDKDDADHYIGTDVIEKVRKEYPKFEFQSHTFNMHNRIKGEKPAESFSYEQIMDDCREMEQFEMNYLAYPWGTYSETMQKALKDSGYKIAFTYRPFFYSYRSDDPYAVNRVKISGLTTMEEFARIVNGEDEASENPDAPENN